MTAQALEVDPDRFENYDEACREHIWRGTIRHAQDRHLWLTNPDTDRWITPEEARLTLEEGVLPSNPLQWEVANPLDRLQALQIALNSITAKMATLTSRYAAWTKAQAERREAAYDPEAEW